MNYVGMYVCMYVCMYVRVYVFFVSYLVNILIGKRDVTLLNLKKSLLMFKLWIFFLCIVLFLKSNRNEILMCYKNNQVLMKILHLPPL